MTGKIYDTDLKYAQWNPFFISLQKDIDQIKIINKVIRKDTKLIDEFFSLINALFNSTNMYSSDKVLVQERINKIEQKIYFPPYLRDLRENNISNKLISYQYRIIKDLEVIFQKLVQDFEANGLLPKIIRTEKKNKGEALLG